MATPLTVSNEREIQPYQLPLEQLNNLKTQHEDELQELQKQMESLFGAKTRFLNSKHSLQDMATNKDDTKLMIPLNASLYAPGRIVDSDKVIVELGTGYFCEKNVKEAAELIDRKVTINYMVNYVILCKMYC